MSRFLVDSPLLIGALEGNKADVALFHSLLEANQDLKVSPVTVAEVFAAYRTGSRAKAASFLSSLELQPISFEVARAAGELIESARRKNRRMSLESALLTAGAVVNDCVLLTTRPRQFSAPGLAVSRPEEAK